MAGGFSAWGITNGAACAGVLADLLAGRDSRFASMLDPRRPGLSALPSLVKQNLGVARTFASGRLGRPPSADVESVEPGEAAVLDVDGTRAAVHRDTEGTLHAVSATCTHLGCTVQWNKVADSWDCPCHGSRFAPDGAVLHGPAVQPLRQVGPASASGKPGTRR